MWPQTTDLIQTGASLHQRGWSLGTSSNYSVVLDRDPLRLLITASGRDKGRLTPEDFLVIDETGAAVDRGGRPDNRPSAETLLHVAAARRPGVGAVLHTHSVWSTVLSDLHHHAGGLDIEGYEMLKGLAGIVTHEATARVEIFENTQDIAALARQVEARLGDAERPLQHGYLIRRHGLYTWGKDLDEARRHVEIFEFLFEVLGRKAALLR
jgi:methylthioribulose-1-phosphate dehydratase